METKLGILFFFLFGMRFSGVTLALVTPIKPFSPVAAYKADRYIRCLRTSISSGAGASDRQIMFFLFFIFCIDKFYIKRYNKCLYSSVS